MKRNPKYLYRAIFLLAAFALWTAAVVRADVQPIGPMESSVGLAGLNRFFHRLTSVHMLLYTITDWLSLAPLGFGAGFALLGLRQWVQRKRLRLVDADLLLLGGFYIFTAAAYAFFEAFPVNFRPVLIEGALEASYPSSTTLLVICVMSTAAIQLERRIRSRRLRICTVWTIGVFTGFMVVGRLISGVHWLSDIIGGILLGGGMVCLYAYFCAAPSRKR